MAMHGGQVVKRHQIAVLATNKLALPTFPGHDLRMNWKRIIQGTAGMLFLWLVIWAIITFSASEKTQMLKQQQKFITALEQRKWSRVDGMICTDYDDGALDATTLKAGMRQVLGGFYVLSITPEITKVQVIHGVGMVKTNLKVEGNGAGLSSMVVAEARRLNCLSARA